VAAECADVGEAVVGRRDALRLVGGAAIHPPPDYLQGYAIELESDWRPTHVVGWRPTQYQDRRWCEQEAPYRHVRLWVVQLLPSGKALTLWESLKKLEPEWSKGDQGWLHKGLLSPYDLSGFKDIKEVSL
jgi:hypothetical protein